MQIKVLRKERRLKKTCAISRKKEEEQQKKKTDGKIKDLDKGRVCLLVCVSRDRELSEALPQSISINKSSVGGS